MADHRANAVGAVSLTCRAHAIEICLVRVASFAAGFAPAAVAEEATLEVPYTAVRGLARRGRALLLAFDPAVVTPYNRFTLVRFGDRPLAALVSAWQWRVRARVATMVAGLAAGLVAAFALPPTWVSGPVGTAAVALCAAVAAGLATRWSTSALVAGGADSDRFRDALEARVAAGMGLAPAHLAVDVPLGDLFDSPARPAGGGVAPDGPRLRAAVAIGLATVVGVASLAVLDASTEPSATSGRPPPERATLRAALGSAASLATRTSARRRDEVPRCTCLRGDSPLWAAGVPTLTFVATSRRDGGAVAPEPDARGVSRYDFDLAVVNNGARPQRDVKAVATFARRDAGGRRVGVRDRGAFWEGDLLPGKAVKWRIRAPGTEMILDVDARGRLDGPEGAAPADAFFDLATRARFASVRLHGATMLAYLGDPRTGEVVDRLAADGIGDEATVGRIRRAVAPLVACDLGARRADLAGGATGGGATPLDPAAPSQPSVCVFNRTSEVQSDLELLELVAEPGRQPRRWSIDDALPIHEGIRVPLPGVDDATAPVEVEVVARGARARGATPAEVP